jgi:hypothetical protein|nr:MAG TPA: hypothetical protein [Caudoviricetes sp.]
MGLDVAIYKTKKVNDFSAIDYYFANEAFDYYAEKELAKSNGWKFDFSLIKDWGIPETMTEEKIKPLQNIYSKKSTIFETVASLEKANQIHAWFVNNIQNGIDDNSYYFVTEDDFLELKEICEKVLKLNPYNLNKDSYLLYYSANGLIEKGIITKEQYAKLETELNKILPTKEGFFFGPIDYAVSYFLNVKNTLEMLTKILDNTDFENEVYLYHSSW